MDPCLRQVTTWGHIAVHQHRAVLPPLHCFGNKAGLASQSWAWKNGTVLSRPVLLKILARHTPKNPLVMTMTVPFDVNNGD